MPAIVAEPARAVKGRFHDFPAVLLDALYGPFAPLLLPGILPWVAALRKGRSVASQARLRLLLRGEVFPGVPPLSGRGSLSPDFLPSSLSERPFSLLRPAEALLWIFTASGCLQTLLWLPTLRQSAPAVSRAVLLA